MIEVQQQYLALTRNVYNRHNYNPDSQICEHYCSSSRCGLSPNIVESWKPPLFQPPCSVLSAAYTIRGILCPILSLDSSEFQQLFSTVAGNTPSKNYHELSIN